MIAQALQFAGPEAAERLRLQLENLEARTRVATGPGARSLASNLDRNERGELLIHPANLPAVLAWVHTPDQWIRAGMDGEPVAPNVATALQVIRALQAEAPDANIGVMDTLASYRLVASEVLGMLRRREGS